jgi:plastocyanin
MARARHLAALGVPLVAAALLAVAILSGSTGAPTASAQGEGNTPHPAHIHSGSCDNLGDIVAPLEDVRELTAGESFGADTAIRVEQSQTDVDLTLGEMLAAPHAINIHQSADEIQNYIACGDLGGRVVDNELEIGLRELNGSGYVGVALIDTDDDDEGSDVDVFLIRPGGAAAEAAPAADAAATTAPDAAATTAPETAATAPAEEEQAATEPAATEEAQAAAPAAEVAVDIRDFAFSPNPVEVPVGGTVTWTNQDQVPHTATAEDRGVLQSGTISPGSSFSQVFDQAGEFPYFCEFHPNMTGTIVVQ